MWGSQILVTKLVTILVNCPKFMTIWMVEWIIKTYCHLKDVEMAKQGNQLWPNSPQSISLGWAVICHSQSRAKIWPSAMKGIFRKIVPVEFQSMVNCFFIFSCNHKCSKRKPTNGRWAHEVKEFGITASPRGFYLTQKLWNLKFRGEYIVKW